MEPSLTNAEVSPLAKKARPPRLDRPCRAGLYWAGREGVRLQTAGGKLYDLLIVGAGPCGMACAIEAQRSGLSYALVDKSCLVSSIDRYPQDMTFFSSAEAIEIGGVTPTGWAFLVRTCPSAATTTGRRTHTSDLTWRWWVAGTQPWRRPWNCTAPGPA